MKRTQNQLNHIKLRSLSNSKLKGLFCHIRAPSWIHSKVDNLVSSSLQDGATKWYDYVGDDHPPTHTHPPGAIISGVVGTLYFNLGKLQLWTQVHTFPSEVCPYMLFFTLLDFSVLNAY